MAYDLLVYVYNEVSTDTACTRYAGKAESNTQTKNKKDIGSYLKREIRASAATVTAGSMKWNSKNC